VKRQSLIAAIGVALASASSPSPAQQPMERWYAGAAIGQSALKIDDSAVGVTGASTQSISKEESDTGFKLFAGHRFTNTLGVEVGWVDFGKFVARNSVGPAPGSSSLDIKMSGFNIDGVGTWRLGNRFSLLARLGGLISETKVSRAASGSVALGAAASEKKSEVNVHFGVGVGYDFSRALSARAEFEQAQNLGDRNTTGEGSPSLLSVALVVKF
jgi:OmpA-OmpF porin, OOP family